MPGQPSPTREDGAGVHWHALGVSDVAEQVGSSPHGLSGAEASARLARHGPNVIEEEAPPSALALLLRQFASPLILILVIAAAVTLVMGEWLDTSLIAVALVLNAVIGFVQERRAADAVRAVARLVIPHSRVLRDGQEWEIDSTDLVPGDVVLLESGSRVPADLRLSAVNAFAVDESLLTGESLPVTKQTAPTGERNVTADRASMAFTGTIVTSGRGRGYVVATGNDTELGSIAGLIRGADPGETPLKAKMDGFSRIIGVAILIAATVGFLSGIALGESAGEMFHTAVAMAVSAVPEGLPIAVTVTLTIGVSRMARRHAVVRRLPAVETLGSTTVVGSDKTGTLTENRMAVQRIWAGGRWFGVPDEVSGQSEALRLALTAGVLSNEAELNHTATGLSATGDPTEVALLLAASAAGIDPGATREESELVAEIPFESERRYSATVRDLADGRHVFVKGAPERVIAMCSRVLTDEGPVPIDERAAHEAAQSLAVDGLRVLAMAYRPVHPESEGPGGAGSAPGERADPEDLVLLGLQGMMDPPRSGVREAIAACRDAGVRVVMITGDHGITALAIARQLGIVDDDGARVVTGSELAHVHGAELQHLVRDVSVFARVSPNDKLRIVRAFQADDHVVAVTGDGVNDAPALRAAAIGVSMGRGGTDVAREASDMVLSDDNFVSIVNAIEEGRVAFANIRKVSFFLLSTAAAETAAILVSVWMGWPLLLVPAQILWLNLVTNGVQDLALAFEPGSPDVLKRPPRPRGEGILSAKMWERTAVTGVVMAAGALVMFRWQLDRSGSLDAARSVALTTLVLFNVFQVGNARSENRSLFTLSPFGNPFLLWATLAAVSLHVAALYLPPTQYILGVEPISLGAWGRAVAVASTILVAMEAHKAIRRRWPMGARRVRASSPRSPSATG